MKATQIRELEMDIGITSDRISALEECLKMNQGALARAETDLREARETLDELRTEMDEDEILAMYTVREILGEGVFHAAHTEYTGEEDPQSLLMYHHGLYIYVDDHGYSLILEQSEWESQCLFDLEERLADYAVRHCGVTLPNGLRKGEYRGHDHYEDEQK